MIGQLSQREKVLGAIVGIALLVLLNIILVKFFLANHGELKTSLGKAQTQLNTFKQLEGDRAMWAERDAWLSSGLEQMGDADVANKHLREALLELAKKHTVTLEAPAPGIPNAQPFYTSLSVRLEAKATWKQMFNFLYELQSPGQFLAVESLDMKVDPVDKTNLRANFTIAKWFAPAK
jgi:hypothetical protein